MFIPSGKILVVAALVIGALLSTNPSPRGNCTTANCPLSPTAANLNNAASCGLCLDQYVRDPHESFSGNRSFSAFGPAQSKPTDIAAAGAGPAGAGPEGAWPNVARPAVARTTGWDPLASVPALPVSTAPLAMPLSSPRLNLILPTGVQRGQTHELEFFGERLGDAQEVFFYASGFSVSQIEKVDDNRIKATVAIAAEVPLGEHIAQVRTATGISDYRSIWVNHLPSIVEVEPNTDFSAAQVIPLNHVVAGTIENEDIDFFAVDCTAGQRLSVEMVAMRLGNVLFDPYVAIMDINRFELAVSDDSAYAAQDGICSVKIPADGRYIIAVRESSFGGNGNCRYQLQVGTFPRSTAIFPAGAQVGQSVNIKFLGDALGVFEKELSLPDTIDAPFRVVPEDAGGMAPSGHVFRLSADPNAYESEPNNGFDAASTVAFPSALNGIIETDGDEDFYKFTATKGQVFDVEVFSRRVRSGLDPVMNIWKADRAHLAGNDDSRGPDAHMRWEVPEDGDYFLRIRDHLGRGRSDFVYRVEFQPVVASLNFEIPRVEQYGQDRQTIVIPRGGRFATQFIGNRINFGGEVILDPSGLPPGITLHAQPMSANLNLMPVVFEAAADAEIGGQLIEFKGRPVDENLKIEGHFQNSADFVLGEPNNAKYITGDVNKLAIAVVEKLPFSIEIQQPQSPLVLGGTKDIKIKVVRDEGFTGQIHVEFPFRSPGIGTRGNIQIKPEESEGLYPLNAAGNSQVGKWPIYAIAMSDVGGPAWSSSQLAELEVAAPFVTMEIPRVGCEQGQSVLVACKINQVTAFEGEATAQLFGLPPHSEAEIKTFNRESAEVVFEIKTKAETNAGKHRGVFCQVTVPVNGEPVVSRAGEFEFQVDVPLPKEEPKTEAMPEAVPEAATPPPAAEVAKPLSRLEKLRLEAQKQSGDQ